MTRRICIVLTTRGNYAKTKSTLRALSQHHGVTLQLVVGGALLEDGYGEFERLIKADGFIIDALLRYPAKGASPHSIAAAAGLCTVKMSNIFSDLKTDAVMVIADRYEALSIAQAALCMNIRIAHLEGGEISGSIDERIRHAITKLAHIHFPANADAAERILKLGEPSETIHITGTPSLDLLKDIDLNNCDPLRQTLARDSHGHVVSLDEPFVVVSQHPVVTEYTATRHHYEQTVEAVIQLNIPTIWILPNDDAGGATVAPLIRDLITNPRAPVVCSIGGLALEDYVVLLKHASCLIGNTSSGIREGAFLGIPTVNIGSRQVGRLRGANVIDVGYDHGEIYAAAQHQIRHGPYPCDPVYGTGHAGKTIAAVLTTTWPDLDKRIGF